MPKTLTKFIQDSRGRRLGCVVATKVSDDAVGVGWSRCRKDDKFDKQEALKAALERATSLETRVTENEALFAEERIAHSMRAAVEEMAARANKYFWPDHVKYTAPNGQTYGLAVRRGRAIAYAPDLKPAARLFFVEDNMLSSDRTNVVVVGDIHVDPDHRHQHLAGCLAELLRRTYGGVTFAFSVVESDITDDD